VTLWFYEDHFWPANDLIERLETKVSTPQLKEHIKHKFKASKEIGQLKEDLKLYQ